MTEQQARAWVDWLLGHLQATATRDEVRDIRDNPAITACIRRLPDYYKHEALAALVERENEMARLRRLAG